MKKLCLIGLVFFLFSSFAFAVCSDSDDPDLILYYPMDEGTGTSVNEECGNQDGTLSNSGMWESQYPTFDVSGNGASYSLDSENHNYDMTYTPASALEYEKGALSFWLKCSASQPTGNAYWISADNGGKGLNFISRTSGIDSCGNNEFCYQIYDGSTSNFDGGIAYASVCDGNWQHHAITFDCTAGTDGEYWVYRDGSLEYTASLQCDSDGTANKLYMLMASDARVGSIAGSNNGKGYIDEVKFYDDLLTSTEITQIVNTGKQLNSGGGSDPIPTISPIANNSRNNTFPNTTITCSNNEVWAYWSSGTPLEPLYENVSSPLSFNGNDSLITDGDYNLWANCGGDNLTYKITIDLTDPGIFALGDVSFNNDTYVTDNYSLSFGFCDDEEYIFAREVLIYNTSGYILFNYTNLTNSYAPCASKEIYSAIFQHNLSVPQRLWTNVSLADPHTKKAINDYDFSSSNYELSFNTDEGNYVRIKSFRGADWTVWKEIDRYRFTFAPFITDEQSKYKFHIWCDKGLKYLENSPYPGHFVCFDSANWKGNWIDFAGTENAIDVTYAGDGWYEVEVEFEENSVTFESIGGLNVKTISYSFDTYNSSAMIYAYNIFTNTTIQNFTIHTPWNDYTTYTGQIYLNLSAKVHYFNFTSLEGHFNISNILFNQTPYNDSQKNWSIVNNFNTEFRVINNVSLNLINPTCFYSLYNVSFNPYRFSTIGMSEHNFTCILTSFNTTSFTAPNNRTSNFTVSMHPIALSVTFDKKTSGYVAWDNSTLIGDGFTFNATAITLDQTEISEGYVSIIFNDGQQLYEFYNDGVSPISQALHVSDPDLIQTATLWDGTQTLQGFIGAYKLVNTTFVKVYQVYTNEEGDAQILLKSGNTYKFVGSATGYLPNSIIEHIPLTSETSASTIILLQLAENSTSTDNSYFQTSCSSRVSEPELCTLTSNSNLNAYQFKFNYTVGNTRTIYLVNDSLSATLVINVSNTTKVDTYINGDWKDSFYILYEPTNELNTQFGWTVEDRDWIYSSSIVTIMFLIMVMLSALAIGLFVENKFTGWGIRGAVGVITVFGYMMPWLWALSILYLGWFLWQHWKGGQNG